VGCGTSRARATPPNVAISCWRDGLPATKERCKPACQSASSRCWNATYVGVAELGQFGAGDSGLAFELLFPDASRYVGLESQSAVVGASGPPSRRGDTKKCYNPLDLRNVLSLLRVVKTKELLKALRKLGATEDRGRGKGGHIFVTLNGMTTTVPTGKGEIATGTLVAILRQLGLTKQDLQR